MTASVTKQVRQAVVTQLCEHVAFSLPCLLLVAISWALMFYAYVEPRQTLVWLGSNLLLLGLRWVHLLWRQGMLERVDHERLEHELFIGVTSSSILWAMGILIYFDLLPDAYRASMLILISLILTGGSILLIGSRRCFLGFLLPLGVTLLLELAFGSEQERILGCMVAGYLFVFLTTLVRRLRRDMLASLYHRFANADLAAELKAVSEHLQLASRLDGLTGIANRAHLDHCLDLAWRRCRRARAPLSLILLDVDYFKQFNDLYGHQEGDACLQQVAGVLAEALRREDDLAARYGGEEFALLLPATGHEGARQVAEQVRRAMRQLAIPHGRSRVSGVVTCSLGVVTLVPDPSLRVSDLIQKADAALYQAKHNGRDRVEVALKGRAA
ncbi:diguanylate cyclase [Aeromonas schubertii]|uniref:GGDEF domain-containing protein n=1 Tax=Aeromonas TaxID=642 RepID=UPI00067F24CB|nr:diguanylate cyclase [Aeromonas schubertii]KUE79890.1 diguanylate cyclase [Aeromonas schubertii]MBZ6074497.1 GGDEF domain-containing protein [Aeromonas schubertii]